MVSTERNCIALQTLKYNEVICKISSQNMLLSIPIMVCCIWYDANSGFTVKNKSVLLFRLNIILIKHLQDGKWYCFSRDGEHWHSSVCISSRWAEVIWHSKRPAFFLAKCVARHGKSTVQSRYIWNAFLVALPNIKYFHTYKRTLVWAYFCE